MTKVLIVGLVIAILSYLFHPDVGQFSIMMNGEPVADPLVRFAAIPTFLVIMLITGVLMVLLFLGVGVFIFMAATFIALLGIAVAVPFFWPILLIIFLIIALMS
ncbi:MAG: hypothetical protein LUQ56_03070 [Methylococcaceae bacterium]|nr:hypothetical protein [Methylococcaceae bacterium]MDD1637102.1 hypothetical protein [Methylococcaceae bacterium]MDD1644089.1 hypothetical protein [Methylococcaceae bacterium]